MSNPYQTPNSSAKADLSSESRQDKVAELTELSQSEPERRPALSPAGTIMPRHLAAIFDNILAAVVGAIVAKQLPADWRVAQAICLLMVYYGYFFFLEKLMSTTPGKLFMGLKIVSYDGEACSWRQIFIRTIFRMIEVNPLLLGAIPAAARILASRDRQRFGDYFADTIVVLRSAKLSSRK